MNPKKKEEREVAIFLWWSLIFVHLFWAVWGLFADWWLISQGSESVTNYLRANSWAFIAPSVFGLICWGVLLWHLFVQSRG